jgi:hypothetical protein
MAPLKRIESRKHHLNRGFDGERSRFEIDHAVQHAGLAPRKNIVHHGRIVRSNAVCSGDKPSFGQARDIPARIVVRGVRYADAPRDIDQFVARERVPERDMVVFALCREIQPSVLADSKSAVTSKRSACIALRRAVRIARCAVQRFVRPFVESAPPAG